MHMPPLVRLWHGLLLGLSPLVAHGEGTKVERHYRPSDVGAVRGRLQWDKQLELPAHGQDGAGQLATQTCKMATRYI